MADLSGLFLRQQPQQQQLSIGDILNIAKSAQELNARKAMGDIVGRNVEGGTFNAPGAIDEFARSPEARFGGPAALGALMEAQRTQQTLRDEQLKFLGNRLGPLLDKPGLSGADVIPLVPMLAKATQLPAREILDMVGPSSDPARLRERLMQLYQMANPATVAESVGGTPTEAGEPTVIPRGQQMRAARGMPSAPGQRTAPGGGLVTGLEPGSEKSAATMQEDLQRARNYGQDIVPLTKARDALKSLGPGGTGPGSKGRQVLEEFAHAISPTVARWAGVDPDKIKNYGEFEKYTTQAIQNRAAGFGAHTDQQLAATVSGNPNVNMNDLTNAEVIDVLIALRRMEQAQALAASKGGAANYTKNAARIATELDPRAFAIDIMKPDQLRNLSKLKGKDLEKFNRSLALAYESGVLKRPGQ